MRDEGACAHPTKPRVLATRAGGKADRLEGQELTGGSGTDRSAALTRAASSGRLRWCSKRATILFRDRPRQQAMARVTVNGTELYHEARGTGPPVLLIMGATGDGGHFDKLAGVLADEFTVITYDRRGNGRSPVPAGWQTTSAEEQADDAAALLDALSVGPAAVFGTSSGGSFALWVLVVIPRRFAARSFTNRGCTPWLTISTRSEHR